MIAKAFRMYGITTVLIGYPLMPDHSLDQLVESCGKAIAWVYKNIGEYNGNRDQIYVSGHSAGGHLAAMMITIDWNKYAADFPADLLKGVCAISGLYNLLPVKLCYVNENLHLDEGMVNRNSTAFLEPANFCPLRILVGGKEAAEYKAQSKELNDQWLLKNKDTRYLEIDGSDHFSILATMLQTGSSLHLVMKQLMNI
jgi:arylformamidase